MLGWELPPFNSGGLGEACLGLARALSKNGVNVIFVLPQKVDLEFDFMDLVFANVTSTNEKIIQTYESYKSWFDKGLVFQEFPSDFISAAIKYAENIKDIAVKYAPDLIHAHDWLTFPAAMVAKEVVGTPLVIQFHSTEFDRTGGHFPNPVVYEIERSAVEKADRIIAISKLQKDIIMSNYKVDISKVDLVYDACNFFQINKLPPALSVYKDLGYKIVLFLGRITLQKGPEYFVRAAKKVLEFEDKVLFVVTGSGDMLERMISEASWLGILNKFLFTGFLQGEEKFRIMQAADLYVMPSVSEPFGMVPLEIIANGTPVLLSKQCGVGEVLNHVLKVDFWDIDEMANKIIAVIRHKCLHDDLVKESGREILGISWDNSAQRCLDIYQQLL